MTIKCQVPAHTVAEASPPYAENRLDQAGECPICAAHRDPVTGEERFNAETIAAFEEGDAMLRGEIPAQRFNSIEELLADLRS